MPAPAIAEIDQAVSARTSPSWPAAVRASSTASRPCRSCSARSPARKAAWASRTWARAASAGSAWPDRARLASISATIRSASPAYQARPASRLRPQTSSCGSPACRAQAMPSAASGAARRIVPEVVRRPGGAEHHPGLDAGIRRGRDAGRRGQELACFAVPAGGDPPPGEPGGQFPSRLRLGAAERPGQRGADAGLFGGKPIGPACPLGARQGRLRRPGYLQRPLAAGGRAPRFPRRRRPAARRRTGGRSPAANSGSPRRPGPAPATCRPGWPAARRPPAAPAARRRRPVRPPRGRIRRAAPTAGPAAAVRPHRAGHSSRTPAPRGSGAVPAGPRRRTAAPGGPPAGPRAARARAPGTGPRPARWPAACRPAGSTPRRSRPRCLRSARTRGSPRGPGSRTGCRPRTRRPHRPNRLPAVPAAARGRRIRRARPGVPCWWSGCGPGGHCPASMTTTRPADPRTCSQLSSTISSSRSASARTTPAIGSAASRSGTPSASATAAGTSAGSVREASSTSRAPSSKPPAASAAARRASRVLPHPPGPVNVTTRAARRPSRTAASCGPRPTSELISAGSPKCRSTPRSVTITPGPGIRYDPLGRDIPRPADADGGRGNACSFSMAHNPDMRRNNEPHPCPGRCLSLLPAAGRAVHAAVLAA